jgi:hypothetical protein
MVAVRNRFPSLVLLYLNKFNVPGRFTACYRGSKLLGMRFTVTSPNYKEYECDTQIELRTVLARDSTYGDVSSLVGDTHVSHIRITGFTQSP